MNSDGKQVDMGQWSGRGSATDDAIGTYDRGMAKKWGDNWRERFNGGAPKDGANAALKNPRSRMDPGMWPDPRAGIFDGPKGGAKRQTGAGGDFSSSNVKKRKAMTSDSPPNFTIALPGRKGSPGSQPRDAATEAMKPIYRAGKNQEKTLKWLRDLLKRSPYGL